MSNAAKNFDVLTTSLSVLHNYFVSSTKLHFDPYPAKILDFSAKPFFLYTHGLHEKVATLNG